MAEQVRPPPEHDPSNYAWGFDEIGIEINRTGKQAAYLYRIGALKGAVIKLGHKTALGYRPALRRLHLHDMKAAKQQLERDIEKHQREAAAIQD